MLMELLEENVISLCMYKNKSFIDPVPINTYENKGLFFSQRRALFTGWWLYRIRSGPKYSGSAS
ncbi:TPA: hypothetical protein ACYSC8_005013, partial [Citrobacter freundii]